MSNKAPAMESSRSSKSHRLRDFLPSIRPSYVSLVLIFVCGFLWLKYEATNDRLLALENRMNMISRECHVRSDSPKANKEGTNSKPTAGFTTRPPSGRKLCQNVAVYSDVVWIIVKSRMFTL